MQIFERTRYDTISLWMNPGRICYKGYRKGYAHTLGSMVIMLCVVQIARAPQSVTDICSLAGDFPVFVFFSVAG